ncbi:MAG TPA: CpsB/CapC family capsule biosynthesis tyrosine phosphatase [Acidobacteriaceae bacterium]|nr:CpsB/CapC family capsule biosynthesis tyrosine phosphatase [Acidobacteriaceae bacterium]
MVDLHHHLLPALDDGAPDLATSLKMARMAADDGITHVVCTPHASSRYHFDPQRIQALLGQLRQAIADAGIRLILGTGCDFHLSYDNVREAIENPHRYTINSGEYLLIELPDYGLPPTLEETFYSLRLGGMTPILTHPERNPTLQQDTSRLATWVRDGMLTQVTAASVTGLMGRKAQKLAERLLADRWVHFIATDAHNISSRPPQMRPAFDHIASRHGDAYAQRLCTENPQAVFDNRRLPPQEPPLRIEGHDEYEDIELDDEKPRGLLRRILRR